jgi:hypothetical protein
MKLTIDLPDDLVREIELRAVHEGRKLNDLAPDLIREGLAAKYTDIDERPGRPLTKDEKSRLPVIKCRHPAAPAEEWTPERVAELLIAQEASWHFDDAGE